MLNLKALKEAAEKATPGPWAWEGDQLLALRMGHTDTVLVADEFPFNGEEQDHAFIALANPSTILSLIERCEELEGTLREIAEADPEDVPQWALRDIAEAALSKADATS